MVHNEAAMLARWLDHYGRQVGLESLIVLDHDSDDGSTTDLPCTTLRLPREPWKLPWGKARRRLVNQLTQGLLACYDVVIFTDVDEFLVPDPAHHRSLADYVQARADRQIMAPVAVNVLHKLDTEAALDPSRPVLEQRHFGKFAPVMCKPLLKRSAEPWLLAFHGIKAPFEVDPDLWMFHLKFYDAAALKDVATRRHHAHASEARGSIQSTWTLEYDDLMARLQIWTASPPGQDVPELDPAELELAGLVRRLDTGYHRTTGTQLAAMDNQPLGMIPARFRDLL